MYIHHLIMAAHNHRPLIEVCAIMQNYDIHNWIMVIHNLQLSVRNVDV